jgi:hypothetical protein
VPSPKFPSAKLLARRAAKVVLNRAALDELVLKAADGAFEFAKSVIDGADVPDATPFGEGLVTQGGVIAYVDRKLIATYAKNGDSVKKPRAAKLGKGIVIIGGFGFPGRFQETGTIKQAAKPFVTPELLAELPGAQDFIKRGVR